MPVPAMIHLDGQPDLLFVAPHAPAPVEDALPLFVDAPEVHAELAARVANWHDTGSDRALEAAVAATGGRGARPTLPRAVVDLNRGWRGRVEAQETLFGKGAVDAWTRERLRPGGETELEAWYRAAFDEIREAGRQARGLVELHSYGDLGSTYDRMAGGRPMRRAAAAIIQGAPWATPQPVGLARLIPADLRGTPWALGVRVEAALGQAGFAPGPSPYPTLLPWTVTSRFLADRWFGWLGEIGRLPRPVAGALQDLAWTDEQSADIDAAANGETAAMRDWRGVRELARALGEWTHAGSDLGDRFLAETGCFTLGVELRVDLRDRAGAFGGAIGAACLD